MELPKHINLIEFIDKLEEQHIKVVSGDYFYMHQKTHSHAIRISIANADSEAINKGVKGIISMIEKS